MKIKMEFIDNENGEHFSFPVNTNRGLPVVEQMAKDFIAKDDYRAIGIWIEQPNNMWGLHTLITKENASA